ncbi:MAG: glucose-6-phosphate isomerase [Actinobacteria bacterium]|nr:glucose-6-phosphate isomerase [Actinomycetota bacterium]
MNHASSNLAPPPGIKARMGELDARAVGDRLTWAHDHDVAERIWRRDYTLWGSAPKEISDRLGWLVVADHMRAELDDLSSFVDEVRADGYTHAVLLGMGGSSLAPEVMRLTFGSAADHLELRVLDSTHPDVVTGMGKDLPLDQTLFIVSSKSGGTLETRSFYAFFRDRLDDGAHFVAITDPDTSLADLAAKEGFRRTFHADSEIGGRYSALSHFGMVPAALMGVDVTGLLSKAEAVEKESTSATPATNPGLWLGVAIGELARRGRDKLTFVVSEPIDSFGLWVEQLVAESTGKKGTGIVPIADEPLGAPEVYGGDRVFAYLRNNTAPDGELDRRVDALADAGHPVVTVEFSESSDLGAQFFLWEFAVAVSGVVLQINAFDQPNVQEAKDLAAETIETFLSEGRWPDEEPDVVHGEIEVFGAPGATSLGEALRALVDGAVPGRYFATMAYVPPSPDADAALTSIRSSVRDALKAATTVGYGPRFLHSTGQLHKGGPDEGVFLQIESAGGQVDIPDAGYGFGALLHAQALGDREALRSRDLPVLRVHLSGDPVEGLEAIAQEIDRVT